jgi:hypothetical protein
MTRSSLTIVAGCVVVSWVVLAAGGCDSSELVADAGQSDAAPAVEEQCLDAEATEPPLVLWAGLFEQEANATFATQFTTDARRCQWTSLGANCILHDCLASGWTGTAATLKGVSAGHVRIGNGTGADDFVDPDANGVYGVRAFDTPRWSAGDTITFTAAGATIPPFTLSIGVPSLLQATDPGRPDAGVKPEIDRRAALTVSWAPTDEKVLVAFVQEPHTSADLWDRQELWCIFDGSAGTGTVPIEALQTLKTIGSSLNFLHYNRRCYGVGGYHLQAAAVNGAWWPVTVK